MLSIFHENNIMDLVFHIRWLHFVIKPDENMQMEGASSLTFNSSEIGFDRSENTTNNYRFQNISDQ